MSKIKVESTTADVVWGAEAISTHLGRSVKATFCALESGKIPGATKIGGRWALNTKVFLAAFEAAV